MRIDRSMVTGAGWKKNPYPGPMASEARHKSGAPSRETRSRNVVPSDRRGSLIAEVGVPMVARSSRPWAGMISSFQDFWLGTPVIKIKSTIKIMIMRGR